MNEEWTVEIVGKLHQFNMTHKEFAERCGYTAGYLSSILHGKKKFTSKYSEKLTRSRIRNTMAEVEDEITG